MNDTFTHVKVDPHGNKIVLTLLDERITQYDCAEELTNELSSAVCSEIERVIVDFENVKFMSSVGYRPFINLRKQAGKQSAKLIICGLSDDMKQIFNTTHLLVPADSSHFGFILADSVLDALEMEL